jgi:hypothetical protein
MLNFLASVKSKRLMLRQRKSALKRKAETANCMMRKEESAKKPRTSSLRKLSLSIACKMRWSVNVNL